MIATNRNTDGREYKRLERSFQRLQGTQFKTDIRTGNKKEVRIFSLIDEGGYVMQAEGGYVMQAEGEWRLDYCELVLSDWLIRAIDANEVVSISGDYFRLRRPLERRIYEIGRKHCGSQKKWQISLAKLQKKTGSNAPLKKFRLNLRQIIQNDHIPFYRLELTKDDLVTFRPRTTKNPLAANISLPDWAEEKARQIASEKGWDYHAMRSKWLEFAKTETAKGNPPRATRQRVQARPSSPIARNKMTLGSDR